MGLLWTALGVGGVLGPLLLGTIATKTGYEVSFFAAVWLAVVAAFIVGLGTGADPGYRAGTVTGR